MTRITSHYGITRSVEFVDLHIHKDNLLFLDPKAIREQGSSTKFVQDANRATVTFFDEVARCRLSPRATDRVRGEQLLQNFHEPRDTRLGMSRSGWSGHGAAESLGSDIWHQLVALPEMFFRVAILKFIEDVPVFVHGIGDDITSDMTTRIVYSALARFTSKMLVQHPEFSASPHVIRNFERLVWDPARLSWRTTVVALPVAQGGALLLIPRDWVRRSMLMNSGRFYDRPLLDYVQQETATVDQRTNRILKTPKYALRNRSDLQRGVPTVIAQSKRAFGRDETNLMELFRQMVSAEYEPLENDELDGYIG